VIAGLFSRQRLLDYVENFILYYKEKEKIIAQNHQFIGVNKAYDKFLRREELKGKLGVFWAHPGFVQKFLDDFLQSQNLPKADGKFYVCGGPLTARIWMARFIATSCTPAP